MTRRTPIAEKPARWGARALGPGLLLTAAAVLVAVFVTAVLPTASLFMVAVVLGVLVANLGGVRAWMRPGVGFPAAQDPETWHRVAGTAARSLLNKGQGASRQSALQ